MGVRLREYLSKSGRLSKADRLTRDIHGANVRFDADMKRVFRAMDELYKYSPQFQRKEILKKAAKPLIEEAVRRAPKSKKNRPRSVYVGEGTARRKIIFYPGNLKRSIRVLPFPKSKDVFVGPKVIWNPKASAYGKNKKTVNAYYAHWIEYGNANHPAQPFMRPAYEMTKPMILSILTKEVRDTLNKWISQNRPTHSV